MYILAIVGSPRLDGNTNYLTDQTLHQAPTLGARTEKIILGQHRLGPRRHRHLCASFVEDFVFNIPLLPADS